MADLPRYQQTGRTFSDLPEFSFANVRESFKRSQSMINSLDRISQFAAKFAEKQVEEQAAQYAVENPITIDELRNASESGVDPSELIRATGGGAIWEDTLRKVQGEQLRAQLEVYGQQSLADIQTQVQLGQLTNINEIKQKFQSAISGYEKPLARISPESAVRFQQSMATTAKAFFNEATKKLEQDYINDQQVLSMQNLENSMKAAKSMIRVVNDPQMLDESKRLLGYRVYEQAREGGTAFAQKQLETFNKEFEALKLNHFTEVATKPAFATSISQAVAKINAGDFGEASMLYQSLPKEEQAKVRKNVVAAWGDLYTVTKNEQEMNKIAQKEENDDLIIEMNQIGTTQSRKEEIAKILLRRDVIQEPTYRGIVNPKKEESAVDKLMESRAEGDIIGGYIKDEKQLRSLYPGLSVEAISRLNTKMASGNAQRASKAIRIAAGASESPLAIPDEPTAARVKKMTELYEKIRQEAFNKGERIDDATAADIAINQFMSDKEVQSAKQSQSSSARRIRSIFPDFNLDSMDVNDYAKKKRLDDVEKSRLKRLYEQYKKAKEITGLTAGEFAE